MTSSLCPTCGTPNPPHSLFCEKCGTRLIASLTEEPEETETPTPSTFVPKGLSLPTKSEAGAEPVAATPTPSEPQNPAESPPPTEEELPDWMQVVQSSVTGTSELDNTPVTPASDTSDQSAPEEALDWLGELRLADQSSEAKKPGTDELLPEWAQRLRTMPEATQSSDTEEVPDWLNTLGKTGQLPSAEETRGAPTPAATEEIPSWMSNLGAPTEAAAAEEEELPEWLKEPATPYFSTESSEPPLSPPVAQAQPATEEMPDWLRDLRPAAGSEESLPDWLDELGAEEQPASESTALSTGDSALDWLNQLGATAPEAPSTPAAEPSDWMNSLRAAVPEVDKQSAEEIPNWLSGMETAQPPEGTPTASETPDWMSSFRSASLEPAAPAEEEGLPDWLQGTGPDTASAAEKPSEPAASLKPVTDWLSALRQAAPETEAEQAAAEEIPDWMSVVGAEETQPTTPAEEEIPEWLRDSQATFESAAAQPPPPSEEEVVPDWMRGFGAVEAEAATGGFAEEQPPEPSAPQKPVTDWLSALRQATPEMESEQAPTEEIPEWMREETGAASQAIGEPPTLEQEIPDWLRETGVTAQTPAAPAEEEVPDWLRETRSTFESAGEQPATPSESEEEGVPDWMRGFGAVEAEAATGGFAEEQPPEPVAPQKIATDWLAALRQATPEMESEQAPTEVPEWLREETVASPQTPGEPQSSEQEIPDWLRETSAVAAPPSSQAEEGVPDWLRPESDTTFEATPAPVETQAEEEAAVPDWLRDFGGTAEPLAETAATPRAEEPTDGGLPDWLRQEPAPAAQPELSDVPDWLREAEPAPALTFEEPQVEEPLSSETPDWLRELTPTGTAVAAEPEAEEPEEFELPEIAEVEAAAPVTGVAGVAKKPEMAGAAPAEIPDWLKEIRQEQQVSEQISRKAIPVPPSEVTGLTQAEIPSWLEALRPTEEAEAPQAAEAPLEVEGPLAGIANALPPAPIMGEMQGLPAKLQFAISAEDQARAGVLRELLTQHAVAPAAMERGAAKGSILGRRALRWVVAILLAMALIVPNWIDINRETNLRLLPIATEMVVPPSVRSAAFEIAVLAQQPPDSKVLVVFDYDATQAGELNRVATALLRSPALGNAQIEVASLNPQGSAMAYMVEQQVAQDVPGFKYEKDLGFVPGQVNGVQSLLAQAGDVKLIIELAASPESVRWWAEQMKANGVEIPLIVGVSAGAESLTMPYLQSGQVKGMVSGFPGAVAYLNATGIMNNVSQDQINDYQIPLDGLTLANYLMSVLLIVMSVLLIVGLIGALLRGPGRRSA